MNVFVRPGVQDATDGATEVVECPVCGGEAAPLSQRQPCYWRCSRCSTAVLHPMPDPTALAALYETYHRPCGEGGSFEPFEARMALDIPTKVALVGKRGIPSGAGTLLDVGCGKGHFVRGAQRAGLDAHGIDLSSTGVAAGTAAGVRNLRAGRIEEQLDWTGCFDVVTCWATLEHVRDPAEFLGALRRVLKPSGRLFLDTGVGHDFVARWAPGMVQWYEASEHMFVFSVNGLQRLLASCGFEVEFLDRNFERSAVRRVAKLLRNAAAALASRVVFELCLGRAAVVQMKGEVKLPFGSLMLVAARRADGGT